MSTYELSRPEAWMLCTTLYLPVQPGSVMAKWLGSAGFDVTPDFATAALESLRAKGIYDSANVERPFPDEFVSACMLASMNAGEISAVAREGRSGGLTRFGQVGERLVQFVTDDDNLTLESVTTVADAAEILYPKAFDAKANDGLRAELPLGVYMYFKQACLQADTALVYSEFESADFKTQDLLDNFKTDNRWLETFHAIGLRGVPSVADMPLDEYREQLIARGFLEIVSDGVLRIGAKAEPLAAAFSDPDMLTLILSLQVWDGGFPRTGMFLCGGGKLFLVEVKPGLMMVQQLDGWKAGRAWVSDLLSEGSRARFANYRIPGAPAEPAAAPAAPATTQRAAVPPPVAPTAWHYLANGQQVGPVSDADLRRWLAERALPPDISVWNPALPGWLPAAQAGLLATSVQGAGAVGPPVVRAFCMQCGADLEPGTAFCMKCGSPVG